MTLAERFWSKVDRSSSDGCWPWLASRDTKGRGQFMWASDRKPKRAHRVAYQLAVGDIPAGFLVCHHCDNPPCCRPDHLFLGTPKDNMQDMLQKGRARGSRWPEAVLADIRASHEPGVILAKRYGISQQHIASIRNGLKCRSRAVA